MQSNELDSGRIKHDIIFVAKLTWKLLIASLLIEVSDLTSSFSSFSSDNVLSLLATIMRPNAEKVSKISFLGEIMATRQRQMKEINYIYVVPHHSETFC